MSNRINDTYKTIARPSKEVLFKEKGSKFYGYTFPVQDEDEINNHLNKLRKEHHSARHWCYAWQLGVRYDRYRANDDGEPNNSAGQPIYGQLQAFELTNTLVVVVRYFGGKKLGVGGLIQAYKNTASMALENAQIITRPISRHLQLHFAYSEMNLVMRIIKEKGLEILSQNLEMECEVVIAVRLSEVEKVLSSFSDRHKIEVKMLS